MTLTPSWLRAKLSSEFRGQREVMEDRLSCFTVTPYLGSNWGQTRVTVTSSPSLRPGRAPSTIYRSDTSLTN